MRIILPLFLVLALLPASASALTVQEVVAMSTAGVSDEVLMALIDRDKTIFTIGPDQLMALKRDNVSERVVLAMLRSGGQEPPSSQTASESITRHVPAEPSVTMFGHGPDRPNTFHEFDSLGLTPVGPSVVYALPVVVLLPTRVAAACQAGRRATAGSSGDRTTGLADASQKFVNSTLLSVLAAADPDQTDCLPATPARPGGRPRR